MPFVLEDGTGVEGANSYVDVSFADAYFNERGKSEWAGKLEDKQTHLIIASDYADQKWGSRLLGVPLTSNQGLELPRNKAYDRYGRPLVGIPDKWSKAVAEYALSSLKGELHPKKAETASKDIKKKKTVVGPITTEVEYTGEALPTTSNSVAIGDKLASVMLGNKQAKAYR